MSRALRLALAREHEDLYLTNASFYHAVNSLAAMLPAMVEGLAAKAVEEQERIDAAAEALMRQATPWTGVRLSD